MLIPIPQSKHNFSPLLILVRGNNTRQYLPLWSRSRVPRPSALHPSFFLFLPRYKAVTCRRCGGVSQSRGSPMRRCSHDRGTSIAGSSLPPDAIACSLQPWRSTFSRMRCDRRSLTDNFDASLPAITSVHTPTWVILFPPSWSAPQTTGGKCPSIQVNGRDDRGINSNSLLFCVKTCRFKRVETFWLPQSKKRDKHHEVTEIDEISRDVIQLYGKSD